LAQSAKNLACQFLVKTRALARPSRNLPDGAPAFTVWRPNSWLPRILRRRRPGGQEGLEI
jgi:hypothetical protein